MLKKSPVWAAYQNLLSAGKLKSNPEQAALADQLGQLQNRLLTNNGWWKHQNTAHESGVYIYGGVGTGKSRIADLFAATLPKEVTRRRAHFFEFMTDVHMRLHRARSASNFAGDPLVRIGQEVQSENSVLCLDEFQVSDIADAMILKRLFGSFWASGGVMVSTSNRHPTELYKNGLNRGLFIPFIEDLQKRCVLFEMKGQHDYRMDARRQDQRKDIFFTDETEFEDSRKILTKNAVFQESVEIPVIMNRKLKVRASMNEKADGRKSSVVVATFASLCEAHVGAADYHALCNFASVIYLSGLRQFASDELDIVRRFITLIDVAYESKTRILCLSTHSILNTFENIILAETPGEANPNLSNSPPAALARLREALQNQNLVVKGEGGSSSSMMSTFINDVEWSATGLKKASLATGGAGETDVRFAVGRAISRLSEMSSVSYGAEDLIL